MITFTEWVAKMSQNKARNILGVPDDATPEEINKAYRELAKKYHPDSNKTKGASKKFIRATNAFETLTKQPLKKSLKPQTHNDLTVHSNDPFYHEKIKRKANTYDTRNEYSPDELMDHEIRELISELIQCLRFLVTINVKVFYQQPEGMQWLNAMDASYCKLKNTLAMNLPPYLASQEVSKNGDVKAIIKRIDRFIPVLVQILKSPEWDLESGTDPDPMFNILSYSGRLLNKFVQTAKNCVNYVNSTRLTK